MRALVPILLLAAGAVGSLQLRAEAADRLRATRAYEPRDFLPGAETLVPLSLGYRRALADLLWMRALVYVGEEFGERSGGEAVFGHADALLALDPEFAKVYRWIGVMGTYRIGATSDDDYLRTMSYLRRGAERFPDDAKMRWDLGASLVFDQPRGLADRDQALSERLEVEGLEHVFYAARHGEGPPWMAFTAATKLRRLGRTEQAIDNLRQMVEMVDDPETRRELEGRIAALREEADTLARDAELEHLELRRRDTYPWLPMDLFILVEEPAALMEAEAADMLDDAP